MGRFINEMQGTATNNCEISNPPCIPACSTCYSLTTSLGLKNLFFSGIGGYPSPPLTENHPAQKPLVEIPLTEKIR